MIFQRKMFFILHYINCPNLIVWLPLLFEILDDMCVVTVCFPVCDVINFEISLILLFKPLFYMTEKSRQICWNISSARFSEFDGGNVILFQIKIFATNIKGTLIFLCIQIVIKIIPWKFRIFNRKNSQVIHTWSLCFS